MDTKNREDYSYILNRFTVDTVRDRYSTLYSAMSDFILQHGYLNKVQISSDLLDFVVIDYFVDIDRIENFHKIEYTSDIKIYAYTAHWILRHKPLQILLDKSDLNLCFVNEEFASEWLQSYVFSDPTRAPIVKEKQPDVDLFISTLRYAFKYRLITAQNIELVLLAFYAGRGYQYSVDYLK